MKQQAQDPNYPKKVPRYFQEKLAFGLVLNKHYCKKEYANHPKKLKIPRKFQKYWLLFGVVDNEH